MRGAVAGAGGRGAGGAAMKLQVVGCSHHGTSIAVRERLAFSPEQAREALATIGGEFPRVEAVLLSTCNRVEIYAATRTARSAPSATSSPSFLARFHGLERRGDRRHLYHSADEAAVRHLFTVAASLDSMVVGEPQILAQVKQAYQLATRAGQRRAADCTRRFRRRCAWRGGWPARRPSTSAA